MKRKTVRRVTAKQSVSAEKEASELGHYCARFDGKTLADKEAVLGALSVELQFPGYFGKNWDGLFDCLTDLSWLDKPGYLLVFTGDAGICKKSAEDFGILLKTLEDAAKFWSKQRPARSFKVLFSN